MRKQILLLGMLLLAIAACETGSETPPVDENAPLLLNAEDLPKSLVTVWFSPTPESIASPTILDLFPTETPEPPEPTITPTPYVGVFVGTQVDGTPISNALPPIGGTSSSSVVIISTPLVTGNAPCTVSVASNFSNVYAQNTTVAQQLGCARDGGQPISLVYQPFERGKMFWRDTRQIYALQSSGNIVIVADGWQEGMPANDPNLQPPSPQLIQPIRGFGLAWRSNAALQASIGWAIQSETALSGYWQEFERGAMFTGENGFIYAIFPMTGTYSGPFTP